MLNACPIVQPDSTSSRNLKDIYLSFQDLSPDLFKSVYEEISAVDTNFKKGQYK